MPTKKEGAKTGKKCEMPGCRKGIIYSWFNGVCECPLPKDIPLSQVKRETIVFERECPCRKRK